jgi:hypothetical protein
VWGVFLVGLSVPSGRQLVISSRRLPFGGESIIYFRTLNDYRRLRAKPKKAIDSGSLEEDSSALRLRLRSR